MASPSEPPSPPTQILAIDGPAGAGKTTLATAVRLLQPSVVLHMDLLYDGWDGLEAGVDQADAVIRAVRAGETASYRRYDWVRGAYAETVTLPETPLLIVEGVGAGGTATRADCVVWVDAPADVRRERAVARGDFAGQWERWAVTEAAHFARTRTREHADLVIGA